MWQTLAVYQVAQAQIAEEATAVMLSQQDINIQAEALLNSSAFTTSADTFGQMLEDVDTNWRFEQLVASLAQDAGRSAQSVSIAARPRIGHVRMLTLPSCSRCAVLAGRVYRYSTGFLRHPGCDCTMIPTTLANPDYIQDPESLMRRGLVTGLSKADAKAIGDGADFAQVVNVRLRSGGVRESGRVLYRRGRMTPEAIYRSSPTQEEALTALQRAGYLR
jgi:hypothetical protein